MTHRAISGRVRSKAFTLIELLVVITIIVLLISLLVPSLENAMLSAQRAKCLTQVKLQMGAISQYSIENNMQYAPSGTDNRPEYHRSNQAPNDAVTLIRDDGYLSAKATICPLLSHIPQYSENYPVKPPAPPETQPTITDWFGNGKYIWSAYVWLPGFKTTYGIEMFEGEPEPPLIGAQNSARNTWVTHTLFWVSGSSGKLEGVHGGRYTSPGAPYEDFKCTDMPIGAGDGGAYIRHRSSGDIKFRMKIGYGTAELDYLW